MPLGSPELLDTFMLGGYQLKANAPEEFHESVKAAYRFFFYKNGPTKVQKGRVIPGPIRLSFKFNGDQALNAARFLKQMCKEQEAVKLSWAKWFSFDGYLTEFDFTHRQKTVTGTLTYQPTTDYLRHDFSGGLTADFARSGPAIDPAQVTNALGGLLGFLATVEAAVNSLKDMVNDTFAPVFAAIEAANDAVTIVQRTIQTFGDIASIPFQTLNELWVVTQDAIDLVPGAVTYIKNSVVDPVIPILEGTMDYIAQGFALAGLTALDDVETNLGIVANGIKPAAGQYEVEDGDSLDIVADLFSVGVGEILQLNPGLSAATLTPGKVIKVPNNGNN